MTGRLIGRYRKALQCSVRKRIAVQGVGSGAIAIKEIISRRFLSPKALFEYTQWRAMRGEGAGTEILPCSPRHPVKRIHSRP